MPHCIATFSGAGGHTKNRPFHVKDTKMKASYLLAALAATGVVACGKTEAPAPAPAPAPKVEAPQPAEAPVAAPAAPADAKPAEAPKK